jgi:hypothetical protein
MARYLSRLLRIALVATLGFGGGVALMWFIFMVVICGESHGALAAAQAGLMLGSLFSLGIIIVMVLLDLTARFFIAKGLSDSFWDLEQKRELVLQGSVKQIVEASRQALLAVPNVTSVSDDMATLSARALTGASWRSPGESIEVEFKPLGDSKCQVLCVSRSKAPNVIFDYGKNFENVETWQRRIDVELKSLAKSP